MPAAEPPAPEPPVGPEPGTVFVGSLQLRPQIADSVQFRPELSIRRPLLRERVRGGEAATPVSR